MQLFLSPSGGLITPAQACVPANTSPSSELLPGQDSLISRLPTEVLSRIFELCNGDVVFRPATSQWARFACSKPVNLVPLMLTCRQWYHIVEPILYGSLFLTFNTANGLRTRRKLQQTLLTRRRSLCQHVQHLQLVFHGGEESSYFGSSYEKRGPDGEEADIIAANKLLEHFQPRTMLLAGDWAKDIDPRLCLALARFEIEELTVCQSWIEYVFRYLEWGLCGRLNHLKLRFGRSYGMYDVAQKWPRGRFAGVDVPNDRRRSIPLESLEVDGGDVSAIEVSVVCQYAAALRKLKLRNLMHAAYSRTFDRRGIQKLLDMHHASLEDVSISIFFDENGGALDFSACSRLKVLKTSDHNLFKDTPEQAAHKMSQIEHLTVDTDAGDQQVGGIGKFDESSSVWIEKFSAASNIKKIHVIFDWDQDRMQGRYGGGIPDQPWPDTHLKALQKRLAESDVVLTWSGGLWTEEEWNAELARLLEEEEVAGSEGSVRECASVDETMQQHSSEHFDSELESDTEAEMYRLPKQIPAEGAKQRRIDHIFVKR